MLHTCKMCGGVLTPTGKEKIITCAYCGAKQTIPCPDSERIAGLYEKADGYRRNLEFDKALALYEEILNEDSKDAECYWLALLCEFGIEYVEETAGAKRIPTINRMQPVSVFDNANYKAALQYANEEQAEIYKAEAEEISAIQKGILEISEKEEPFDIFICYKEGDGQGRRTLDSVLATDIYELLTKEGYKVFFSRVTLDDKLGVAYEPYIYAALQSSKVMIAVGTKPEHYNAVWVRNEWSRYLALIKSGAKKVLIPAYKDMDPYALPEEFKHLQAINLGELGYQQDLVRGIRKIIAPEMPKAPALDVTPLVNRMILFLEDKKWEEAERWADKILRENPGNIQAETAKLMAAMHVSDGYDYRSWTMYPPEKPVLEILEKGTEEEVKELKKSLSQQLPEWPERLYQDCKEKYEKAKFSEELTDCAEILRSLKGYRDSAKMCTHVKERMEELRKREEDEYNEMIKLSTSRIVSDVETALKLMKESKSSLLKSKDIARCEAHLKVVRAEETANRVKGPMLAVVVAIMIIAFIVLMLLNS